MTIEDRNIDIVRRALPPGRETFAALGEEYGLSRERVRQIFDKHATKAQRREISAPSKPDTGGAASSMARREPKVRMHVLVAEPVTVSHDDIRHSVAKWCAGKFKLPASPASGTFVHRLDIFLPEALDSKFKAKCDRVGIKASAAIRAIITALETEE